MLITRANYIETKRSLENQKKVNELFLAAGWQGSYDITDLYLINKSVNDLPFSEVEYNETDAKDLVSNSGELLLPANELPYSFSINSFHRPEPKEVWYNGLWFVISFFHDGSICDVQC